MAQWMDKHVLTVCGQLLMEGSITMVAFSLKHGSAAHKVDCIWLVH